MVCEKSYRASTIRIFVFLALARRGKIPAPWAGWNLHPRLPQPLATFPESFSFLAILVFPREFSINKTVKKWQFWADSAETLQSRRELSPIRQFGRIWWKIENRAEIGPKNRFLDPISWFLIDFPEVSRISRYVGSRALPMAHIPREYEKF